MVADTVERLGGVFTTPLGRLLLGIIKLALAGFLIALVATFQSFSADVDIGGAIIPIGTILKIIIAFFPILLLISAIRDLGIRM